MSNLLKNTHLFHCKSPVADEFFNEKRKVWQEAKKNPEITTAEVHEKHKELSKEEKAELEKAKAAGQRAQLAETIGVGGKVDSKPPTLDGKAAATGNKEKNEPPKEEKGKTAPPQAEKTAAEKSTTEIDPLKKINEAKEREKKSGKQPLTGDEFYNSIKGLTEIEQQRAIIAECAKGNMTIKYIPIEKKMVAKDGTIISVKYYVSGPIGIGNPPYYSPMSGLTANIAAEITGNVLPSKTIVLDYEAKTPGIPYIGYEEIMKNVPLNGKPLYTYTTDPVTHERRKHPNGELMRDIRTYKERDRLLKEKMKELGLKPGDPSHGHSKTIVYASELENTDNEAIFGGKHPDGSRVQQLNPTSHETIYHDYTNTSQFVFGKMEVSIFKKGDKEPTVATVDAKDMYACGMKIMGPDGKIKPKTVLGRTDLAQLIADGPMDMTKMYHSASSLPEYARAKIDISDNGKTRITVTVDEPQDKKEDKTPAATATNTPPTEVPTPKDQPIREASFDAPEERIAQQDLRLSAAPGKGFSPSGETPKSSGGYSGGGGMGYYGGKAKSNRGEGGTSGDEVTITPVEYPTTKKTSAEKISEDGEDVQAASTLNNFESMPAKLEIPAGKKFYLLGDSHTDGTAPQMSPLGRENIHRFHSSLNNYRESKSQTIQDIFEIYAKNFEKLPKEELEGSTVAIMIGTNDIYNGKKFDQFQREVTQLCTKFRAKGMNIVMMTVPPIGDHPQIKPETIEEWGKINKWIKGQEVDGLKRDQGLINEVVNIDEIPFADPNNKAKIAPEIQGKGLHFSAEGYKKIAASLANGVNRVNQRDAAV